VTTRSRLLLAAGTVLLPVALSPLLLQPQAVFVLAAGVLAIALAVRSIAYPVALAGLPAAVIGLTGSNPFPPGAIAKVTAVWVAVGIALAVARSDQELPLQVLLTPLFMATLLLAVVLLVRLGTSLDPHYGSRKVQLFFALNVIGLAGGVLVGRRRERIELWALLTLGVSALSALALLRNLVSGHPATSVGGRFSLTDAGSPIGLSREAALGLVLAAYVLLASKRPAQQLFALLSIPVLAVAFAAGGSRGPVLGLIAGLLVLFAVFLRDAAARRRVVLIILGGTAAALLVPQLVPGGDIGRTFSVLTGGGGGLSSNGRSQLWSAAWHAFTTHPFFGIGTGSFHALGDVEFYPHNLFLETAAEWGIVGVVLLVTVLVSAVTLLRRTTTALGSAERAHVALISAVFASALVNALFSGDITDNDPIWLAAGLALGLAAGVPALARELVPARLRPAPRAESSTARSARRHA
jgi:O-antigen ligase